ncbi:Acbp [Punctularia strigosozonata HHB-11173 SS5]|uniref:Acbp n=1 Tax=Punctularia strigosozonata (strain HHB-11173) TaxID=741275 RepID=UPI0004416DD1|nr:Acbp [Punctularia strigosozonata HHB-11173 SS5]EIN10063.1 Acbp [Punctularia strigosozonata HHB-11173 SS5]
MSKAKFEKAVEIVQNLPKDGPIKPSQDEQLLFYKYYKQATAGDVNTTRPGMLDFVGKAKWDAWNSVKGVSPEEAYEKYVAALIDILKRTGNPESEAYIKQIEAA